MQNNRADFTGRYCEGKGNTGYLELIEKSFAMFSPQEKLPYFQMLYNPTDKTLKEGFMWGNGWWIQNSFGFSKNATAFLSPFWLEVVQNSYDLFWDRIGDGKRLGADDGKWEGKRFFYALQAPDGCLGDTVLPGDCIIYKQGDGKVDLHDWFYEATAAQILIQCDIILRDHNLERAKKYLPLMERSSKFIEGARDRKNNLFLVGPACNLLAPSYGGSFNEATGEIGKGYLTGLSVTYAAALHLLVEVCLLAGEKDKAEKFAKLEKITKDSLKLLLTDENYLVKSMDPDGRKHGVYGADKYGYLDGVTNIDALAWEVVSKDIQTAIYEKIKSIHIRPFDFMLNNAPTLDDTYHNYAGDPLEGIFSFGEWVNGGCWGTVEGRAILAYSRLRHFKDIASSVERSMKWAEDYRMDAPFTQCGDNTFNLWSDNKDKSEVSVMIDNFAIPAGMIRGIFDLTYNHNGISFTVNLPEEIEYYQQKAPLYFGGKKLYFAVNGIGNDRQVYVNGKKMFVKKGERVALSFDELPDEAFIEIIRDKKISPSFEQFRAKCNEKPQIEWASLVSSLTDNMKGYLKNHPSAVETDSIEQNTLDMIAAYAKKKQGIVSTEHFRPLTQSKKEQILEMYQQTAEVFIKD